MVICWERADLLISACAVLLYAVFIFVPFPYGVWERTWNSIVPVPNHCLFIYLDCRWPDFKVL